MAASKVDVEQAEGNGQHPPNVPLEGQVTETQAPDPFDPERFRLSQDFATDYGVQRQLTRVPVRKPSKQDFIRVRPEPAFRLDTLLLELKDERELYLVDPQLRSELFNELVPARLYTAINRQGVTFLWPVRLPGPDGRINPWHETAKQAAELAMTAWIRVIANNSLGGYEVHRAMSGRLGEPEWPGVDFTGLLKIAFRTQHINSLDHPVVRRLHGLS